MIQFFTKRLKNRKGFTLIELVVVIGILGALALIAVPRLGSFRDDAEDTANLATARTILSAATIAEANYGSGFTEDELNEYLNDDVSLATSAPTGSTTGWTLVRPDTDGSTMTVYKGTELIDIP
ncbi:type IV pilus assembly protein PilA [Natronincola peptidivorans]|uniref:Type IV pilus assembly protein PilA n=1 Tax=Natronincola peptidivorans TaxID=426128 RepID=A0A1H9YQT0_9FIRM|nr:type II secretion system protein [Natronincola peptidivorans]SES71502.1 type IV pilus assembly protein PilA [Natronincola peptidivorans]